LSDVVFCDSVTNAIPFLVVHGSKIRSLELQECENYPIFDLCPNMTHLLLGSLSTTVYSFDNPTRTVDPAFFACKAEHRSLEKIDLNVRFG
jgi:hypothetical protein